MRTAQQLHAADIASLHAAMQVMLDVNIDSLAKKQMNISGNNMDKKEVKREYKETIQPMGVYQIKNLKSGKIFIGSATNIHARINRIKFQLKNGLYPNKQIQNDYSEVGESGFSVEVLDYLTPTKEDARHDYKEDLQIFEEMFQQKMQPFGDNGYNINKTTE